VLVGSGWHGSVLVGSWGRARPPMWPRCLAAFDPSTDSALSLQPESAKNTIWTFIFIIIYSIIYTCSPISRHRVSVSFLKKTKKRISNRRIEESPQLVHCVHVVVEGSQPVLVEQLFIEVGLVVIGIPASLSM
jgi:hypothetical protein